jgi:peptide/nickel transport system permease protein
LTVRLRSVVTARNALVLAGLGALIVLAAIGPVVWDGRADHVDVQAVAQGASWSHPFGTDNLGRDLLARSLVAGRTSLTIAAVTTLLGFALGVLVGMFPVVLGARARRAVVSAIGLVVAFPSILIVLLVVAIVGPGVHGIVVALAIAVAPTAARLTQTLAAAAGNSEYVAAARVVGVSRRRLLLRHVLPNVASPLVLQLAQAMSAALLASSALSFLGIGVQEPDYDWGALLNVGLERIYVTPLAALGPAAIIVTASLILNATGNTLATALAGEAGSARRRSRTAPAEPRVPAPVRSSSVTVADDTVLRIEGLSVSFPGAEGPITPVKEVSLAVRRGERVGVVGESGSGKTLTALSVADLIEPPGEVRYRELELSGADVRALGPAARQALYGTSLAMVLQNPLGALNPVRRIGGQMVEGAVTHLRLDRGEARSRAVSRLKELGIAGPERRMGQHPHELSGGMSQRVVIAMGLMTEPALIIADEPTTALDATVQRQVLHTLRAVNDEHGTAVVLISHDMSVITTFCERIVVMYAGRVVEEREADRVAEARHPYTRALLDAVPDMATDPERPLATIPGRPPVPDEVVDGCAFAARCAFATDRCRVERPRLEHRDGGSVVACWNPLEHGVQATSRST